MSVRVVNVELGVLVRALLPPNAKDIDRAAVEIDRSAGGTRLAASLVELVSDGDE